MSISRGSRRARGWWCVMLVTRKKGGVEGKLTALLPFHYTRRAERKLVEGWAERGVLGVEEKQYAPGRRFYICSRNCMAASTVCAQISKWMELGGGGGGDGIGLPADPRYDRRVQLSRHTNCPVSISGSNTARQKRELGRCVIGNGHRVG